MHYTIYQQDTGEIRSVITSPEHQLDMQVPAGCSAIFGDYSDRDYCIDLETFEPVLKSVDPATLIAAQWEAVRSIRNSLRDAPISLADGWLVDADPDSVDTMKERVEMWGVGTDTMIGGKQLWKGADNDIRLFTQAEFSAFVTDVRIRRTLKVDANFAFAEQLRAQLPLAADHPGFDPANWPG